jgi:aspartyl-tRNA(Asn)/glutamyl-tRNA(Gln) amidotransferase subunit B
MAFEAVIGLECHIQLRTRTKLFCACPVRYGAPANDCTCPVCLGLPGSLPRVNDAALGLALRLGLALGCRIRERSVFARKHYFYPDMPKNYQVTQYDQPLCEGGALPIEVAGVRREVALTRIHAEEDAGKSFHPERHGDRQVSRVEYNRAGTPLLELVTEPVLTSPEACAAFLTELRRLVRWLGLSDGDMEKGQLRCDANVSLRPVGATTLGTKTELKNLNSIKGVEKGVTAEIARQQALLTAGERVVQSTLLYDADHDRLVVMRTKEQAQDYRYLPDPDLPVLVVAPDRLAREQAASPELPWVRQARLATLPGLTPYDAALLTESREWADLFEAAAAGVDPKKTANWLLTEVLRTLKERGWSLADWERQVPLPRLREFLGQATGGTLPGPLAKQVFGWMLDEEGDVATLLARHGVAVQASTDTLLPLVRAVVAEHAAAAQQVREGRAQALGFLTGQVMRRSGGQAVPQAVQALLRRELGLDPDA